MADAAHTRGAEVSLPGFAFAYATSSFSVLKGAEALTVRMFGAIATPPMALKSFTGS
jgi:hypothetical protein